MGNQLHGHGDIHAVLRKKPLLLVGQILLNTCGKVNDTGEHLLLGTHQHKCENQKNRKNAEDKSLPFHCFFGRQE